MRPPILNEDGDPVNTRPDLTYFATLMEVRLREHENKAERYRSPLDLFTELTTQMQTVEHDIFKRGTIDERTLEQIVDAANFAMLLHKQILEIQFESAERRAGRGYA